MYAWAAPNLHRAHMSEGMLSHVVARMCVCVCVCFFFFFFFFLDVSTEGDDVNYIVQESILSWAK